MYKVLHIFPDNEPLIAEHVRMLLSVRDAEFLLLQAAESEKDIPDIVHLHGCWNVKLVRQALKAHRRGARIVMTPHGGLEPWIIDERRLTEKLSKTLLWQRRVVERAYVMIVHGTMEGDNLKELGWNPRMETIRNAVVTNTITPEAMARQTIDVYRKVMDSNTLELMDNNTRRLMALMLKAGITGDSRWVERDLPDELPTLSQTEWRRLLIYADQENIRTLIDHGARLLKLSQPYIETQKIVCYLPTNYQLPKVSAILITDLVNEMHKGKLSMRHLVELDRMLRRDDIEDDRLTETLDESRQLKFFRRLLQLLTEQTLLEEGFLPTLPLNDNATKKMRRQLNNRQRI